MLKKSIYIVVLMSSFIFTGVIQADLVSQPKAETKNFLQQLLNKKVVDLSQKFDTNIPHWSGYGPATRRVLYNYEPDGFFVEEYCHVGQWGTHVDAPGHFFRGKRMLDDIKPNEMIMPLVAQRNAVKFPQRLHELLYAGHI